MEVNQNFELDSLRNYKDKFSEIFKEFIKCNFWWLLRGVFITLSKM